jgi:glycosyltransferase involved in cell wall biosynthesis
MHALKRFSSLNVALVPDDKPLQQITEWLLRTEFSNDFFRFHPKNLKAVHSHVFPWFIRWCHHQKVTTGVRWVHTHHNWYYPEFGRNGLEPWQEEFNREFLFALNNADVALAVSKAQQKFLLDSFGIRVHYLPNGVDAEFCRKAEPHNCHVNMGRDHFFLYVGRNDPIKNPVDFVRLAEQLPQHRFLMLGQELSEDSLAKDWNVQVPRNLTVAGAATHRQTLNAIAACSALIVTSRREGLPTLVLEAMACGKPVVVPDEQGCLEAIGHGDFGWVYEQNNIDQLVARTLEAAAGDPRCIRAKQRVDDEYDWRVILKKIDRIYCGENPNQ